MKTFLLSLTAVAVFTIADCGNNGETGYAVDELADIAVADKEAFMGKTSSSPATFLSTRPLSTATATR